MIIKHNVQLRLHNSFKTKALAKIFCETRTTDELVEVIRTHPDERKLILGAGYNLFFTKNFDGLVIKPVMDKIRVLSEDNNHVDIEVGAGVNWDYLVEQCVERGYSGLENLSLIPSSVGASPVQNIGAYGAEVCETITNVNAVDINTGELKVFNNEECEFGYRNSIFKQYKHYAIYSVSFRLNKSFSYKNKYVDLSRELNGVTSPTLSQVREAVIRVRSRKLPDVHKLPNAGSFFKNPILNKEEKDELLEKLVDAPVYNVSDNLFKTSAAFLIDRAGYKGKRLGMVGMYEYHSLIMVNYGTEDGRDIVTFMKEIQKEIKEQFDIMLEPEVQIY